MGLPTFNVFFWGPLSSLFFIHYHQSYNDTSLYPGCFQDAHQIHLMIFVHMFFLLIHPKKRVKLNHLTSATPPAAKRSSVPGDVQQQNDTMAWHFTTSWLWLQETPERLQSKCDQREKHIQNRRCKAFFLAPPDLQPPWKTCYKLQDHETAKRSARCVFFTSEKLLANTCKPSGAIHLSRPKDQGFGQRMQWTLPLP